MENSLGASFCVPIVVKVIHNIKGNFYLDKEIHNITSKLHFKHHSQG